MKKLRKFIPVFLPAVVIIMLLGLILARVWQPEPSEPEPDVHISPFEASDHVGKVAEVCGMVESADYIPSIDGEPTFLNLGRAYPDQPFTAIIWGTDRQKWDSPPEQLYLHREICITGRIEDHEGTPQIRVRAPERISLRK